MLARKLDDLLLGDRRHLRCTQQDEVVKHSELRLRPCEYDSRFFRFGVMGKNDLKHGRGEQLWANGGDRMDKKVGAGRMPDFLVIGAMKPIFPNNVGFFVVNGPGSMPSSLSIQFPAPSAPAGGNWVILIGLVFGLGFLVLTHKGAKKFLAWGRARRAPRIMALP